MYDNTHALQYVGDEYMNSVIPFIGIIFKITTLEIETYIICTLFVTRFWQKSKFFQYISIYKLHVKSVKCKLDIQSTMLILF
jgi:hypothetical protein